MNLINDLVIFIIVILASLSFVTADEIFAKTFRERVLFLLVVADLSYTGLWILPNGLIKILLLMYAFLASCLLAALAWSFLFKMLYSKSKLSSDSSASKHETEIT